MKYGTSVASQQYLRDKVIVSIEFASVFKSPCPGINTGYRVCACWVTLNIITKVFTYSHTNTFHFNYMFIVYTGQIMNLT